MHALDIGTGVVFSYCLDGSNSLYASPGRCQYHVGVGGGKEIHRTTCVIMHAAHGVPNCFQCYGFQLPPPCIAGSGLLAVLAARAGADTVVACDLHEPLAAVARRVRVYVAGCNCKLAVSAKVCRDCLGAAAAIPQ